MIRPDSARSGVCSGKQPRGQAGFARSLGRMTRSRRDQLGRATWGLAAVVASLCLPYGSPSTALLKDSASLPAVTVKAWSGCSATAYRSAVLATAPDDYLRMAGPATAEADLGSVQGNWTWTAAPASALGALACDDNTASTISASTWLSSEHRSYAAADSAPFSYAFWVKAASGSQGVLISSTAGTLSSGATSRGDRATWITPTGLLAVVLSDGPSTRWITTTAPVTDGQWHFVVVTLQVTDVGTGRGTRLYLDGTLAAFGSQMRKGLAVTSTESWRVGPAAISSDVGALQPVGAFTGQVDEVAVWSKTLSAAEVSSMWAARAG